jgi:hypothetical protein
MTPDVVLRKTPITAQEAAELSGEVCVRCHGYGHHEGMRIYSAPGKGSYCPVECEACGGRGFVLKHHAPIGTQPPSAVA